MKISNCLQCPDFPCSDVRHESFSIPSIELDPDAVRIVLISESAPANPMDYYYTRPEALFAQTTLLAFGDAGLKAGSLDELLSRGIYLTSAIKCGKTGYGIATETVDHCSHLLEQELSLFPLARVYLLMGDVAIKALNTIAHRNKEPRPVPAGSTYKIRSGRFTFRSVRVFPSYLQAGPSFFIEKSKRTMIAEDIRQAITAEEQL